MAIYCGIVINAKKKPLLKEKANFIVKYTTLNILKSKRKKEKKSIKKNLVNVGIILIGGGINIVRYVGLKEYEKRNKRERSEEIK